MTAVYGIVPAETPLDDVPTGIGEAPVSRVQYDGLAALVSPFEGAELRATRRDLLSHAAVLEHALRRGPVLPLRFGTVLADDDAVVSELLEPSHEEFTALLRRFEHMVELRVKAFYDEEAVLREIVAAEPEIARLRTATRQTSDVSAYSERLRLGEAVAHALEARRRADADALFERLRPLAVEAVAEETDGSFVLVASFLVERDRVGEFDRAMDEVAREQEGRIGFKYLGPLPPHSFVSITKGGRWAS